MSLTTSVPADVWRLIALELPLSDISNLSRTCKSMMQAIIYMDDLWKLLYHRNLSTIRLPKSGHTYQQTYQLFLTKCKESNRTIGLNVSIKYGYEKKIKQLISQVYTDLEYILWQVCYHNYQDIVDWMLLSGARDYNRAMIQASAGGNRKIIDQMLALKATDYNSSLTAAARRGHYDIVKLMLSLGATEYSVAFVHASSGGYTDIFNLLLEYGANDYNWALEQATKGGQMHILNRLVDLGASDYDSALKFAYNCDRDNYQDLIDRLLELGATPINPLR